MIEYEEPIGKYFIKHQAVVLHQISPKISFLNKFSVPLCSWCFFNLDSINTLGREKHLLLHNERLCKNKQQIRFISSLIKSNTYVRARNQSWRKFNFIHLFFYVELHPKLKIRNLTITLIFLTLFTNSSRFCLKHTCVWTLLFVIISDLT